MRLAAILLLALALRVPAMNGELWMDEILSLDKAREAGTPWGVWAIRHDNNHRLNSLWLLCCPDESPAWLLRLPSLLAGLAAVVLARQASGHLAALLVASSWWPVMLSTEARGYSLAIAFSLGAFLALRAYWPAKSLHALAWFWGCVILAFLSHLAFLIIYVGFVAWSARRTEDGSSLGQIKKLAAIHAVPGAFLLFYWLTAVRGMHIEGGPPSVVEEMLLSLVSRGLGGPGAGGLAIGVAAIGLPVFAAGLARLARKGDEVWVFFAVAVLSSPLLVLVRRPPFLFERYFALPWVFFLLVTATGLQCLLPRFPRPLPESKAGWAGRVIFCVLLAAFLTGSLRTSFSFHRYQRGQMREAIAWIAAQDAVPTVAADNDFRVRTVLTYHNREGRVRFVAADALPPGGASWLLVHHVDASFEVSREALDADGNVYELAKGWPSTGPADWGWFVFRNAGRKAK